MFNMPLLPRRVEAAQQRRAVAVGEGRAVYARAQLRQLDALQLRALENVRVFRQAQAVPAAAEGVVVVVAGGDDHRHGTLGDGGAERLLRLREGHVRGRICPPPAAPAAPPAPPCRRGHARAAARRCSRRRTAVFSSGRPSKGLSRCRSAACKYPYQVYLTASARRQAPVSVSSSKMRPLQLAGARRALIAPRHVAQELAHRLLRLLMPSTPSKAPVMPRSVM